MRGVKPVVSSLVQRRITLARTSPPLQSEHSVAHEVAELDKFDWLLSPETKIHETGTLGADDDGLWRYFAEEKRAKEMVQTYSTNPLLTTRERTPLVVLNSGGYKEKKKTGSLATSTLPHDHHPPSPVPISIANH
ncbi:hypothetical protein C0Q70_08336 [Pomacea canaliculata]|uniref:Uncharacterized protein n=1 Tax=Pomacea canaliculata TaxID=400727 RepID=A0A2T7PHJ3_POMCA|nr:hypothetical protein C0Q70_08336 [Pomacea canaliculata]